MNFLYYFTCPLEIVMVSRTFPARVSWQFMDIWNRLYRERILYIGQDLDDEFANQVLALITFLLILPNDCRKLIKSFIALNIVTLSACDTYTLQMIAVLLFLQKEDSTSGVQFYFNCPGGEVSRHIFCIKIVQPPFLHGGCYCICLLYF